MFIHYSTESFLKLDKAEGTLITNVGYYLNPSYLFPQGFSVLE